MANDELIALLQGFRDTLAANQATHQANADAATATIAAATVTQADETAHVAGYTDALADIDAEIAKLQTPAKP